MAEQYTSAAPSPFPYDDPATSDIEIGLTFDRPIIQSPVAQPITTVSPKVSNWKVFRDSVSSGVDDLQGTFGEGLAIIGNYLSGKAGDNIGLQNIGSDFSKWGEAMRLRNREEAARRQAAQPGASTYKEMYAAMGEGRLNDAWQYIIKAIGRQGPMLATYAAAYAAGKTPAGFGLSAFYHSMENYREQLEEAGETDPMAIGYAAVTNSMLDVLLIGRVSRLLPGGKSRYDKFIAKNLDQPWLKDKMKGVMGALAYGGGVESMQELNNLVTTRYVKEGKVSFGWDDITSDRVIEAFHQGAIVAMPFGLFYRSPSQASDAIEAAPPKEGILSRFRKTTPPAPSITTDSGVPAVDTASGSSADLSSIIADKKATATATGRKLGGDRVAKKRAKAAADAAEKNAKAADAAAVKAAAEKEKADAYDAADAAFSSLLGRIDMPEMQVVLDDAAKLRGKEISQESAAHFRQRAATLIKNREASEKKNAAALNAAAKSAREDRKGGPEKTKPEAPFVIEGHPLVGKPSVRKGPTEASASPEIVIRVETRQNEEGV